MLACRRLQWVKMAHDELRMSQVEVQGQVYDVSLKFDDGPWMLLVIQIAF